MEKTAIIGLDGKHRYWLSRCWDFKKKAVGWVMLNPSTADDNMDDPTIKRCIDFAKRWGYGGICVVNLFPFRATDPKKLLEYDAITLLGNQSLYLEGFKDLELSCEKVICAWGNNLPSKHEMYLKDIKPFKQISSGKLHYLDLCNSGNPKHPLYLKSDLVPIQMFAPTKLTKLIL